MKTIDQLTHKVYVVNPDGGPAIAKDVIFSDELQGLRIKRLASKIRHLEDFTPEDETLLREVFGGAE